MKKSLHFIAAMALAFCTMETKAQLADGSTAPNFTFTDMNGNTQDLYTYLNAGKVVVIDVSAIWCNPCWLYHTSGNLENFYNQYGPPGTNQAMVLYIEGDAATSDQCMTNSAGCTGGPSQGNWVSGTAYPMCNPPAALINPFNTNYAIGYFPTMYMICLDKKIKKVDQYTTAQLASAMNATCPPSTTSNDAGVSSVGAPNAFACGTSFTPVLTLRNYGSTALTSCTINYKVDNNTVQTYNWVGNLTTNCSIYSSGCTATVTLPSITVSLGNHTFTAFTSNPNSTTDGNTSNDQNVVNFAAVVSTNSPITEGMEGTLPSANCSVLNPDNGITFAKSVPGGFGTSSNSAKMDCYNYAATGENDYLVIPPVDFSVATNPQINFNVAYAPYDATYFEKLDVEISTDCGTTWTNVYSKSGATLGTAPAITTAFAPTASQWRSESISLTSYIGQPNVMAHFKCTNGFGNDLYIDDINITAATGIASINSPGGFSIYPNPATSSFTIEGASKSEKVHYSVYNMVGAEIKSGEINVTGNNFQGKVQATNMSSGVYFLRVNDDNYSWVQKITIK